MKATSLPAVRVVHPQLIEAARQPGPADLLACMVAMGPEGLALLLQAAAMLQKAQEPRAFPTAIQELPRELQCGEQSAEALEAMNKYMRAVDEVKEATGRLGRMGRNLVFDNERECASYGSTRMLLMRDAESAVEDLDRIAESINASVEIVGFRVACQKRIGQLKADGQRWQRLARMAGGH